MSAPRAPARLDGAPLSDEQQRRLQGLIDVIWSDAGGRAEVEVIEHARTAFRLTADLRGGAWQDRTQTRLNGGRGPVLRLKGAA